MAVDALARALAAGKVPVTAYEMAVKAGYTGTEEQFAEDMGNSGTNAANAAASASAAAASAESVSASATQIAANTSDISDLKTQIRELGYSYVKYTIPAGTEHSSTRDKIPFNAAAGDTFYLTVNSVGASPYNVQVFAFNGSTSQSITTFRADGTERLLTAPIDMDSIGLYSPAPAADTVISAIAENEDSIFRRFTNDENIIAKNREICMALTRKCDNDSWAIGTLYNGQADYTNKKRIIDETFIPVSYGTTIITLTLDIAISLYTDANVSSFVSATDWTKNGVRIDNTSVKYIRIAQRVDNTYVFQESDLNIYDKTVIVCYPGTLTERFINDIATLQANYTSLSNSPILNDATVRARTFNASYHTGANDFQAKCQQFAALMYGEVDPDATPVSAPVDCESFLFFTDPHTTMTTGWEDRNAELITEIQKYYNSTPTTFCLCGGDWLGNSDLPADACFKLGYIDGFMHSMFKDCYMLVGNHDTNYQGKKDSESERSTTRLSNDSIVDLWYRKEGKAYYKFSGANSVFYCFDTGIENQALSDFDNYGIKQCEWFAQSLLTETEAHIVLATHILYQFTPGDSNLNPIISKVLEIAEAYNDKSSITINGNVYSFASVTGKIELIIAGHSHADYNGLINGIPVIMSINAGIETTYPSFDLMLIDYDNSKINCIRVGTGNDRTISLITGQIIT